MINELIIFCDLDAAEQFIWIFQTVQLWDLVTLTNLKHYYVRRCVIYNHERMFHYKMKEPKKLTMSNTARIKKKVWLIYIIIYLPPLFCQWSGLSAICLEPRGAAVELAKGPFHDDVTKWKYFPRYWPFVRGIQRSPVNSPHKGQCCGALMFSLICTWINRWVNNREAGDLRCHHAHHDVIVTWVNKGSILQNMKMPRVAINCVNKKIFKKEMGLYIFRTFDFVLYFSFCIGIHNLIGE